MEVLELARDKRAARKDRIAAYKFLADNGWSKPKIEIEVDSDTPSAGIDLSSLDDAQIAALAALRLANPEPADGEEVH